MPYYDVANLVTVPKTNMIDEMPCGYGTLRTTGVRIWQQVSHRPCADVSAALNVSHRPAQRSQQLQHLTIPIVQSRSILNAPPSLQVLSGACENALAESESTLQSSRGGWEHLEVLRSTGEGYRSVWEVCVWLPDRMTFCSCKRRWYSGRVPEFGSCNLRRAAWVLVIDEYDVIDVYDWWLPMAKNIASIRNPHQCEIMSGSCTTLILTKTDTEICCICAVLEGRLDVVWVWEWRAGGIQVLSSGVEHMGQLSVGT